MANQSHKKRIIRHPEKYNEINRRAIYIYLIFIFVPVISILFKTVRFDVYNTLHTLQTSQIVVAAVRSTH